MSTAQSAIRCFDLQEVGYVAVVRFTTNCIIEDKWIYEAGKQLYALVDQQGRTRIIIDLINVGFISSTMLGKFITLHKKLASRGSKLVFCDVPREVYDILAVTRCDRLFCIKGTLEEALAEFSAR